MDIRKLQRAIVDGLEDVKGHDIAVFNTEHLSPLFERVIIASGNSNRQTKALAASVRDAVKASGHDVMRVEGEANGEWIIVDCGAAVVHLMQPTIREYYHLEEIWGDKPVKMKFGATSKRLAKAETEDDEAPAAVRKKRAAPRPADSKAAAKPAAGRPAATKKTAASKAVTGAKKSAPAKRTARKAAPVRTVKIGLPTARKTAASKSAAGKTAARPAGASRKATSRPASAGVTRTVGVKRPAAAAKKASRKT
jgi:ribosome-associated protein